MKRWFLPLVIGWIALHLIVYFILPRFIPYLGFFPYKEAAQAYHLPGFLTSMANFDGEHYILIAKNGYSQFEQAFFPLYPMLIRFLGTFLGQNYLLAAVLISSISFFFGLLFFQTLSGNGHLRPKKSFTNLAVDPIFFAFIPRIFLFYCRLY